MASTIRYKPLRKLGQNFLTDQHVASQIVAAAELTNKDVVLEPGAGYGILTRLLERESGLVIAVEKDPRLASYLRREFAESNTVSIIEGDVIRVPLPPFNKVVGTPSYKLSSRLILFLTKNPFQRAALVFQKEFGERLLAEPGSSEYGRLSVTAQRSLIIRSMLAIPSSAFRPRPKVDSLLLGISPKISKIDDGGSFEELVRGLFNQRRRLVRSSLLHFLSRTKGEENARKIIGKIDIPEKRVYQLSFDDIERLREQLKQSSCRA